MKMETWSFLKNFMTLDLQKVQKIGKFPPIFFLIKTTKKGLIYVLTKISGSFGEF